MVPVHNRGHAGPRRHLLKLAPGIELSCEGEPPTPALLVSPAGKVHLNQHALDILELCDGSRSRDRVVVEAMLRSAGSMRAADVVEFLEAAQSRGWIIEGK
ncbi:MAG: pyrroloquinoline quinone biosynthesis peptide chaperone PqqD [Gammaproteobacteria bacterium]|nr:pyrroloquinoline quinone biosynthesis peptide chaperone PqqD [Gammaproteobacteria bacterium]